MTNSNTWCTIFSFNPTLKKVASFRNEAHTFLHQKSFEMKKDTNLLIVAIGILYKNTIKSSSC